MTGVALTVNVTLPFLLTTGRTLRGGRLCERAAAAEPGAAAAEAAFV